MTRIDSTRHRLSTLLGLCALPLFIALFALGCRATSFQSTGFVNHTVCQPKWESPYLPPEANVTGTFSIVAVDPETGVCGAAVASKYPAVGKVVPYARPGVGAFCTQYGHNPDWAEPALDMLARGDLPEQVLAELLRDDAHRDKRQLAIIDMSGRAANRNPANANPSGTWWGAASGKYYACQGNTLVGQEVIFAMAKAYEQTKGSLADRLMAALIAGDCAGGDHRGRLAAGMRVAKEGIDGYWLEMYVDNSDDAVIDLARKYAALDHEAKGAWRGGKLPLELLIAKGAEISNIYLAVYLGDVAKVRDFIEKGTDVNAKNAVGDTPLHYAAKSGSAGKDIIELLIAKGIDVNAKNNKGQTPLDVASDRNRKDIVKLLIEKGATIPTIQKAAQFGILEKVREFIKNGADVNAKDEDGWTPLYRAVSSGHADVAELLIAKGANVNTEDKWGYMPLVYALWNMDSDMVKLLLEKGADTNVKDTPSGYTALHWAVMMGSKELTELVLAAGANVNVKTKAGETPLDVAAYGVPAAIGELLLAKGAEVSSLHAAAFVGDLAKVKAFIDEGVEVNSKIGMPEATALHSAAAGGRREVAEFLILKGADISASGRGGKMPLHLAVSEGHRDVVELLVEKGADVNAKDKRGLTPLGLARKAEHLEIAELLRKHGAKE